MTRLDALGASGGPARVTEIRGLFLLHPLELPRDPLLVPDLLEAFVGRSGGLVVVLTQEKDPGFRQGILWRGEGEGLFEDRDQVRLDHDGLGARVHELVEDLFGCAEHKRGYILLAGWSWPLTH